MKCKHYNAWAGVCRNEECPSFKKSCNDYEHPVTCKYSAEKESRMIAALSKLPKMVTDDPKGNFEVMLNLIYGKDGWSYIRYGDEDMQITDFCFKELCPKFGCPEFADQTMTSEEQDELLSDCVFDSCPAATVYAALSGYSHLRDRLRKHEDAMTNRVLTLQEVRNAEADTFGTVMHWLELQFEPYKYEGEEITCAVFAASMVFEDESEDDHKTDVLYSSAGLPDDYLLQNEYGKKWRCWLKKPTQKEMEETPWGGSDDE